MLTIKKILCPVDFSEPSYHGLATAVDLAEKFGAEIEVLFVLPVLPPQPTDPNYSFQIPEYEGYLHRDAEIQLAAVVKEKIPAGIKVVPLIGHGNAGKEIVRTAEENKSDLVVIASNGHSGWHNLVMGSVAEKVVRHSCCPVFIARDCLR
jgi:universal stress protein A